MGCLFVCLFGMDEKGTLRCGGYLGQDLSEYVLSIIQAGELIRQRGNMKV